MTLLDFDLSEIYGATSRQKAAPAPEPQLREEVTITPRPSTTAQAYLARQDEQWSWEDLRDYVVTKIQEIHGPQPRDHFKEMGTFKGFLSRWEEMAPAIARYAFEVEGGWWRSAPISTGRFAKGSDPFFSAVILDRLGR